MKCVHGISLRKPCRQCGCPDDWKPREPVCNCQGRGLAITFHLANCPVRVAAVGMVKP